MLKSIFQMRYVIIGRIRNKLYFFSFLIFMDALFYELLRVSIGKARELTRIPTLKEWALLYNMSEKQALIGVSFYAILKLPTYQMASVSVPLKM